MDIKEGKEEENKDMEDLKKDRLPTGSKYRPYYTYMNENKNESDSLKKDKNVDIDKKIEDIVNEKIKEEKIREDRIREEILREERLREERLREEIRKEEKLREERRKERIAFENSEKSKSVKKPKKRNWFSRNKIFIFLGFILLLAVVLFAAALFSPSDYLPGTGPKIAVLNIHETMITGEGAYGFGYTGSDTLCALIRKAVDEEKVDAIVFRINSGGGSGSAADEIVFEINRAKEKGVIIISTIGDAGASAAYWVASQSDYIYVTNSTITGSIGAIGMHEDHSKKLEEEGVNVTVFKSGPFKDMGSQHRPLTDEEKEYWQQIVDDMKNNMVREVAKGRNLDEGYIQSLADGRIITGQKAIELKLVDEIGNFYTALDKAKELIGKEGEPNVLYMDKVSLSSLIFGAESKNNENTNLNEKSNSSSNESNESEITDIKIPTVWMKAF